MDRYRVAVIGSSFPNRLHAHMKRQNVADAENLFVNKGIAEVVWCAHGGLTLDKLHRDLWPKIAACGRLDAAIIQIGSNDMCTISVDSFVDRFALETLPGLRRLGCSHVTIAQAFYRRPGHYTHSLDLNWFNRKIDALNDAIKHLRPPQEMTLTFWTHANVLNCGTLGKIWSPDGVHFNQKGDTAYSRSMSGALKHTANILSG